MKKLFLILALLIPLACWAVSSVTLNWTASTTPSVTYDVLHSATGQSGTWSLVNSAPVTGTTYTDTVNLSGFWEVVAIDSNGDQSIASNVVTIPNGPTGLKAVANN